MTTTSVMPTEVATDEAIRTSPYEMVVTLDQIKGEVTGHAFIAVTLVHDQVDMYPLELLSPLSYARVGATVPGRDGNEGILLGSYVVCGIAGSLVLLRLMSNRACTEYAWCLGHEDGSRDNVRHSAEPTTLFTFDGDDANNRALVETSRFIEDDEEHVAVSIEYDLELTHPELLTLADELEAAAKKIRAVA